METATTVSTVGAEIFGSDKAGPRYNPYESGFASQSLKVYVPDIDSHFNTAKNAGADIILPLQDMFWGGRIYRAKDPEGHVWELSQADKELSVDQWKLPGKSTRS